MKLHQNIKLFQDAVRITAQQMNIPPEFIEKDYWVTYALHTIFNSEVGKDTVFKGGTALSKCYKLIERFSEDIDLVVLRREGETDSKLKSKIREVSKVIELVLPEVVIPGITNKRGMNRKTAHSYNKTFTGNYGQVMDVLVLESTWLGYYEPCTQKSIVSYVGNMMINNGQKEIAEANGLMPFSLMVLESIRTICEKIMSLVRFSYGENPIDVLKKKIRHTYDLHQLLKQKEFSDFFNSLEFDKMLLKVANDDVASFRNNNIWLVHHPKDSLIFSKLEEVWNDLESVYYGDFKNLVYGELPNSDNVLGTMKMIKERLNKVEWTVKIEAKA
ncbi:MAG: nucleotidyl transferase AbiEii/AbiGii toxin family protein [Ignavibacteriales bacterium]|nr:nucleotidyl transferase AbiEii/AbiGii toxin family protein [Ignavibacteriales bacterium]MCF8314491.1 nucleotidyl transferase AbiEii/AbiGii toxin family protein [Ignavibacteriales bacterium]MCF8436472.1 nucleotidyl transferase AbiEii/AbiGii toxin family protein [Ignavibacteriales bacterium]